jgi:(S)-3,5-dihydroxyphenylglycine transaminase
VSSALENTIFDDPILNVIHLLNSIAQENPHAISLASGRPDDGQCDPSLILCDAALPIWKNLGNHQRGNRSPFAGG